MIKWSEIMEQNREEIIEALEKSFRDAVNYRHMQHITEIYPDGTVRTWACAAGSNDFSSDLWNGKSMEIGRFCFQNIDIETTEEDFRRHMTEEEQTEVEIQAEEENRTFEGYIYSSGNYEDLIDETETEWREWYKDEYAYSEAERILYEALEREEHYLEACGGQYERRIKRIN